VSGEDPVPRFSYDDDEPWGSKIAADQGRLCGMSLVYCKVWKTK